MAAVSRVGVGFVVDGRVAVVGQLVEPEDVDAQRSASLPVRRGVAEGLLAAVLLGGPLLGLAPEDVALLELAETDADIQSAGQFAELLGERPDLVDVVGLDARGRGWR